MFIENWLVQHRIWLDALTALGTVGATVTAVVIALKTSSDQRRETLSGLAIVKEPLQKSTI